MGVSGLLGLLKSIQKPCNLKGFRGQTIGVDAYGWLHRGAIACAIDLAQGKPTTKFVHFAMHRVRMLIHFGITPYLVFDGDLLPSKKATEQGRNDRRCESKKAGLELLRLGKTAMAYQELQKAVDITPEMARMLIDELNHIGVRYVVAPYEADSQLAYLERLGFVDAVISEDSDLLVFGARCLLTKLDQYGECVMIRRDDFTSCREVSLSGWTTAEFRRMAILSGCDYLAGIPKLGLRTAHRLVRKYKTIDNILRGAQLDYKLRIPIGYLENFSRAERTFIYQWVYCPESQRLVNVTEPESYDQLDGIDYIGSYVEPEIAVQVASGVLNPMTKEPIVSQPKISTTRKPDPSLRLSRSVDAGEMKSIESFFKPKHRQPLAELDPNCMQYTNHQRQLIEHQGTSRSWTSVPAPPASAAILPIQPQRRSSVSRPNPGPNPSKRQRLCADNPQTLYHDTQMEKSRFFGDSSNSNPSKQRVTKNRKSKAQEFELWSDESLENAMSQVPVGGRSSLGTRDRKKIPVYDERKRNEPCSAVLEEEEEQGGNSVDQPQADIPSTVLTANGVSSESGTSLATSLEALDGKQETATQRFPVVSPSRIEKSFSQVVEPATTPLKPVTKRNVERNTDFEEFKDDIVQESPVTVRPVPPTKTFDLQKFRADDPEEVVGQQHFLRPRGSEDLLIPNSESDGEPYRENDVNEEEDGEMLSPSPAFLDEKGDAPDESDDEGREGGGSETFDLRKFVYAAATA